MYSTDDHATAREKQRFEDNLHAFNTGTSAFRVEGRTKADQLAMQQQQEAIADEVAAEIDRMMAEFDNADVTPTEDAAEAPALIGDPIVSRFAPKIVTTLTQDEMDALRARMEPTRSAYRSPFDIAGEKRHALAERLENLPAHLDHLRPALEKDLANAWEDYRLEIKRSTDDEWRKKRAADKYRVENPEEYNASRRTKRDDPNVMTPKAMLATETPEQKKARLNARKAELMAAARAAETPEQAAERKAKNAANMAAARAAKKLTGTV